MAIAHENEKKQTTAIAAKHSITYEGPAVDFFEGALMGNGGLGVVVTTRPDAVVLHFGHNNVWDIRIAEDHQGDIGTFREIFEKVQEISRAGGDPANDPWFREYCEKMGSSYKKPYPRPMPCGSLVLGFDRREAEILGHRLHIASGLCEVDVLVAGNARTLRITVEPERDRVWLAMADEQGGESASPFGRISLLPDPVCTEGLPEPVRSAAYDAQTLSFAQRLPAAEDWQDAPALPDRDKAFRLSVRTSVALRAPERVDPHAGVHTGGDDPISDAHVRMMPLDAEIAERGTFVCCVQLDEGSSSVVEQGDPAIPEPTGLRADHAAALAREALERYWSRSGVVLADSFLERIWYRNLYFFYCAVRPGMTAPGLYGNWSYKGIGSIWHGDYHMDYNAQQPYWVAFTSNHADRHEPYADMIDHIMGVSKRWAQDYYGLRGAYVPVSLYPVEMGTNPYPVPTWGWQTCVTPWAVQSLWWHYEYTRDAEFLKDRAIGPMREAVLFLVDYMNREEAFGERWGDDKHHIFPTVTPELYGLTADFAMNADCLVTLTLTKFLFKAYLQACRVLEIEQDEAELRDQVAHLLAHFPDYPRAQSLRHGEVLVSVPGENPEIVYNVPSSCMPVFPGEDIGLHSPPEVYDLAVRSYRNQRVEGGNDLVFRHLQGARLGMLDIEKFKRQIRYCLLPNGTCTDKVLQTGGRYEDTLAFDFMARLGVWAENFSLPAVVNECLLQSYNGILRFFPNWPRHADAAFTTLRAVGGFLVSACLADGAIRWIEIVSEQGSELKWYNPWDGEVKVTGAFGEVRYAGEVIAMKTAAGERLLLQADWNR